MGALLVRGDDAAPAPRRLLRLIGSIAERLLHCRTAPRLDFGAASRMIRAVWWNERSPARGSFVRRRLAPMIVTPAHAAGAADAGHAGPEFLSLALVFLAAAVIAVPLANKARLGAIVGYLAGGILIGPQVLGLVPNAATVLAVSELGIVMFLFIIGLEMKPSRIWAMRNDIFGLGSLQVFLTIAIIIWVPLAFGRPWAAALVAAMGLAICSTGVLMQVLAERGETQAAHGQRAFAVAIFQDLMVVPMLAVVALLAPAAAGAHADPWWWTGGKIVLAVAAVILAGRYLLDPLFRVVALAGQREIMTAAALLVVIGAAFLMTAAGLSMAMGAFLAGIFLAESKFRHQLEADIEPFRGVLMGLFFIAIGMSVNLAVIAEAWWRIAIALACLVVFKAAVLYAVMRALKHDHAQSVRVSLLLAQAGEFGFVLYAAATASGVMAPDHGSILVALVVLSMALAPFLYRLVPVLAPEPKTAPEREESFAGARGSVLVIGFGRFGQIACQMLLPEGVDITAIDNDIEMIDAAERFGFKVYYGDGARFDVLRAAGAENARLILVCTDQRETTTRIVEIAKQAFPLAQVFARSFDRQHTLELLELGVDYELRETYESAARFGREALVALDVPPDRADEVVADMRRRDAIRLNAQRAGDIYAGADQLYVQPGVRPAPLVPPKRGAVGLNPEARAAAEAERRDPTLVDGGAGL
jgi:glutathione-regulated potassium-efflux system protein KefB